jgi:quinoprotein glucose dehydrogenase
VSQNGNPTRGRALYLDGKSLACINCHRLEGVGGNVGPDLTRMWETQSLEKLIEAILEPGKEIKEGFQSYVATTKKGQTFTGLKLVENSDEVILRDAEGHDLRLARKDVEQLTASKTSLMPDNVVSQLSYSQLIDLIAFLKDRRAQESLRGLVLEYHVIGPFGRDLKKGYPPETNIDPAASYLGQRGESLKWQPAQAEPSGLLNLRAIFKEGSMSAYALTYIQSPKAQQVEMLVGSGEVRLWLNGKLAMEHATPRPARAYDDRVTVRLEEGWNAILAKVVGGEKDHGLYLRFVGEGLRVSRNQASSGR